MSEKTPLQNETNALLNMEVILPMDKIKSIENALLRFPQTETNVEINMEVILSMTKIKSIVYTYLGYCPGPVTNPPMFGVAPSPHPKEMKQIK